jgi:hypothetical protein
MSGIMANRPFENGAAAEAQSWKSVATGGGPYRMRDSIAHRSAEMFVFCLGREKDEEGQHFELNRQIPRHAHTVTQDNSSNNPK